MGFSCHPLQMQSPKARKIQCLELEVAGHIAATTREQKENGGSCSASFPFIIQSEAPAPRMVPPKAKVGFPPLWLI